MELGYWGMNHIDPEEMVTQTVVVYDCIPVLGKSNFFPCFLTLTD